VSIQAQQYYLEGIWQQFVRTTVAFKFFVKNVAGDLEDSHWPITAVLEGPEYLEAEVSRKALGEYSIAFVNPQFEGDYQMHVLVNGREMYQWLVQLREQRAQPGGTVQFFIDGPALGGGEAAKPVFLNINVRSVQGAPVDVEISNFNVLVGPSLKQMKAKVERVQTGLYRAHFTVPAAGMTPIDVRYCGNSVMKPPLMVMFW